MTSIRLEKPEDASLVRIVNERAFEQRTEANLVDTLRRNCAVSLSLVAEDRGIVGHPEYYPRFGFAPGSRHGLACQWESVPDAAFMVLVLDANAMAGVSGIVRYRDEFDEVT